VDRHLSALLNHRSSININKIIGVDLSFDPLKSRIIDLIEILDEICSIYPVQVSVCVVPKPFWTIHSRKIKAGYLIR